MTVQKVPGSKASQRLLCTKYSSTLNGRGEFFSFVIFVKTEVTCIIAWSRKGAHDHKYVTKGEEGKKEDLGRKTFQEYQQCLRNYI